MALHPEFPASPYAPLIPERRWRLARKIQGHFPAHRLDLLPLLSRRYVRAFKDLSPRSIPRLSEAREIIFQKMLDSGIDRTIHFDAAGKADWPSVGAFFARQLPKELRLVVGGYEFLYPAVRAFIKFPLFEPQIDTNQHRLQKFRNHRLPCPSVFIRGSYV